MLLLLHGFAPPVSTTAELLAVTSVLPVLMIQAALGSLLASRVNVPVRWTSETVKQYDAGPQRRRRRGPGPRRVSSHGWFAASVYAVSASCAATSATASPAWIAAGGPCPGGKPTTAVPGNTPRSPLTTVGPVFVIVVAATAAKRAAEPSGGVVATACAAGAASAESAMDATAPATPKPMGRWYARFVI